MAMMKTEPIRNITATKKAPMAFNIRMDAPPLFHKIGFGKLPSQIENQ
jgi:hypothetical protein